MWTFEEPAVLRRLAQRNGTRAKEDGDYRSKNGGLVRVQTFGDNAVLRRNALENVTSVECQGVERCFWCDWVGLTVIECDWPGYQRTVRPPSRTFRTPTARLAGTNSRAVQLRLTSTRQGKLQPERS